LLASEAKLKMGDGASEMIEKLGMDYFIEIRRRIGV
jgi:hypothetical protein